MFLSLGKAVFQINVSSYAKNNKFQTQDDKFGHLEVELCIWRAENASGVSKYPWKNFFLKTAFFVAFLGTCGAPLIWGRTYYVVTLRESKGLGYSCVSNVYRVSQKMSTPNHATFEPGFLQILIGYLLKS